MRLRIFPYVQKYIYFSLEYIFFLFLQAVTQDVSNSQKSFSV